MYSFIKAKMEEEKRVSFVLHYNLSSVKIKIKDGLKEFKIFA